MRKSKGSPKKKKKLVEGESLKQLHKTAWAEWSIYIRTEGVDWKGMNNCFTCGTQYYWSQLQAGHYKHGKLDFCKKNIHKQCVRCNKWLHGNLGVYAEKLIKKYGPGIFDELDKLAKEEKSLNRLELKALIHDLKAKNGQTLKRLGLR